MGYDPLHGPGPFGVTIYSSQTVHWEATKAAGGYELVLPTAVDGNGEIRVQGDGIICPEEAEYDRTIYCNAVDSGPIQGDGMYVRGVGS